VIQPRGGRPPYGTGMWIVELSFGGTPEGGTPERLAARPAHRERLVELHRTGVVRMAGPWADDAGAVLVFDVPDEAALDRLLAADPYFSTPGVQLTVKREWRPII